MELDVKQLQIALGAVRSELEQVQKSFQLEKLESSRLKMQIKETEMIYKSEYDSKNNYSSDRNNDLNLELNEL